MKKRWMYLLMVLVVSVGLLAGCNKAEQETVEMIEREINEEDRETLTVGFDASFPPYGYEDESGNYVGFDLDLAAELCERNGWELILQPIDWDAKDMELDSGTVDCIWNGFTINGREGKYEWTEPYVDNSQVVVVRQDAGITNLADLAGKEVMVQADSSALSALEGDRADLAEMFQALTEVPDYNTAFMSLEAGATDAVAMDIGVANYQLESRDGEFVILEEILAEEQYGVGCKLGNTQLRDQIQKTLNEMAEDGTFMRIAELWDLADAVSLGK